MSRRNRHDAKEARINVRAMRWSSCREATAIIMQPAAAGWLSERMPSCQTYEHTLRYVAEAARTCATCRDEAEKTFTNDEERQPTKSRCNDRVAQLYRQREQQREPMFDTRRRDEKTYGRATERCQCLYHVMTANISYFAVHERAPYL
jgi:hypothetical protein